MVDKEEWNKVEIPDKKEEKVDFEIEGEVAPKKTAKPVEAKEKTVEEPEELDGIETKGAQKRIRQLVKQRKEKEEQLAAIMQQNEELTQRLQTRENEVKNISKHTLDISEKQLTDKLKLAESVYLEAFEEGDKNKVLKIARDLLEMNFNIIKSYAKINLSLGVSKI